MAKSTSLRKLIKKINKDEFLISSTCQPGFARNVMLQLTRSCCLINLAADGDDISQVAEAIHQTDKELYGAIHEISKAEQALEDWIPVIQQCNDELSERLTWPEHWYLDQDPFIFCLERRDIVSALRRSPIRDSARFGEFLREQMPCLTATMRENIPSKSPYTYGDKLALLAESVGTADPRGGCDIFHCLAAMVVLSWFFDMCARSSTDCSQTCEDCPARKLSQQLLGIIAGALEERNHHLHLHHDPASHTSKGFSCDSEFPWLFLQLWKWLIGLFKELLAKHPRHCYENDDDSTCSPCPVKRALPVVRALQTATVNEVTDNALMACGGRLPVELSDLVVQASLLAEGLPLGPSIWEIVERPSACNADTLDE